MIENIQIISLFTTPIMRSLKFMALLLAIGSSGCTPSKPAVPSAMSDPSFRPVPPSVIAKLPQKIARLPVTKSMSLCDFLGALDLEDYNSIGFGGVRFCSHFMDLDQEHVLQIRCLPESVIISTEDIDMMLASTVANPAPGSNVWARRSKVVGCTLRKGWNDIIAHRWLAERKTQGRACR